MSQQEQTRLKVLNSVMVGQLPVGQAAEVLGISERHVRRILAAYREEGAAALVHGNRGRRPANATSEAATAEVMLLAATCCCASASKVGTAASAASSCFFARGLPPDFARERFSWARSRA